VSDANGDNKIPVECIKCHQHFSIPMPALEVSNNLRSSSLHASHNQLYYCNNARCHQPYTIIMGQYQVAFGAAPVNEEAVNFMEGSKIVKPKLEIVGGLQ